MPQSTPVRAALLPTAKWAPATPQVIRVCLNVWLYFYISALWNPTLYKRPWRGVPAAFGWCFCSPNEQEREQEPAEWPAPFYTEDHNSAAFPLDYPARLGALPCATDTAASKEFTGFCNAMQTSGRGVVLPAIPHQILTRKSCLPCSVYSHLPGIHHTEVSNDSTCLF